ncbi:hypothetical protein PNEG_01838 [Pneumocystis murina B123]|uniref:U3 small nucleolar RNA-associated protein 15 C-terminal domain-containing protein n=1 Tax=Pneumocystis murina (strain B123) TaxID=1069680 RepID=M7PHZ4_PNEMU|nr:hypothetical protein PNEG_01838 [Pneumocystis murina B123]EMR10089.1 hypothetical protein PNEG_01838 [Pneumocystis murina B123]
MAAPAPRLIPNRFSAGPLPVTPEQKYWQGFKSKVTIKEIASISHIHFCCKEPHDFAVTSSARIQIYSSQTRTVKKTISRFKDVAYSGEIRADGKLLIASDNTGTVQLFDISSRSILRSLYSHKLPVHVAKFSPYCLTTFLSASDDKTIRIWDLPTSTETCILQGNNDYIRAADFLSMSHVVLSGCYDGTVRLWDIRMPEKKNEIKNLNHGKSVDAVLSLKDGSIILSAGGPVIKVWDMISGKNMPLKIIRNHQKSVICLSKNNENSRILSGGLDGHVKIYDIKDWENVHDIKYPAPILSLGLSPDNKHLAVGMISGLFSIRSRQIAKSVPQNRNKLKQSYTEMIHENNNQNYGNLIVEKKRKALRPYDKALKSFHYADALDLVLENKSPLATFTVINELKHRSGLYQALQNRDDVSLEPILRWLIRYLPNPRYVFIIIEVLMLIIDIYGAALGHSILIQGLLLRLSKHVSRQIEYCKDACSCNGMLEMLFHGNQGS